MSIPLIIALTAIAVLYAVFARANLIVYRRAVQRIHDDHAQATATRRSSER